MKYLKRFEINTKSKTTLLIDIEKCLNLTDDKLFDLITMNKTFDYRRVSNVGMRYSNILVVRLDNSNNMYLSTYDGNKDIYKNLYKYLIYKIKVNDLSIYELSALFELIKTECNSYEFQKEFLENHPDRVEELEFIGYNKDIEIEYEHLINADKMGLL